MKLRDIMAHPVVRIHPEESVAVAARILARYNIGLLPVCGGDGRVCGVVTDRDLVTRCIASGRQPASTQVREVMTTQVVAVRPDMDAAAAAYLMGKQQIRRLPVVENGRICGYLNCTYVLDEINTIINNYAVDFLNVVNGTQLVEFLQNVRENVENLEQYLDLKEQTQELKASIDRTIARVQTAQS